MSEQPAKVEADRQAIREAKEKGPLATIGTYTRLSGPGWLQSALTLGGGSLGSSLYLGVLAGFSLLWLQPMAMILGIIMLSAIGYVAMSTKERPFQAINRHVNPVLGWGWALATLAANMVWCLPQYSLASGVLQQNLMPGVLGADSPVGDFWGKIIISGGILTITLIVTWAYDSGGRGIKLYELMLKLVVAGIVLCFAGVVTVVTIKGDVPWSDVLAGFIPDFTKLYEPAETFDWLLAMVPAGGRDFWSDLIVAEQRDVMISAAATAVGINMTFLLPYSMIRRGWDKDFRGLAIFDLSTGMFIPFLLATSCVVIASSTQFHLKPEESSRIQVAGEEDLPALPEAAADRLQREKLEATLGKSEVATLSAEALDAKLEPLSASEELLARRMMIVHCGLATDEVRSLSEAELEERLDPLKWSEIAAARELMARRLEAEIGEAEFEALSDHQIEEQAEPLSQAEILLAEHLKRRDAFDLSQSLSHLTGETLAHWVFGIGVVGMTLSSITLLMLISGFVICEMFGLPPKGWPNRLGALAATTGVVGPFLWAGEARFYLVVPTSVFCFTLLPFAYLTFFLVMNSKSLLGDQRPRGVRRVSWNLAMGVAALIATAASIYMVWVKASWYGIAAVMALALLVIVAHFAFPRNAQRRGSRSDETPET